MKIFLVLKELVHIIITVFGELLMHIISVLYQLHDLSFGENKPTYNLLNFTTSGFKMVQDETTLV